MVYFLIVAAIVLLFFATGKLLSRSDKHICKKYMKGHEKASDRMVNNYWGNMLSMLGFIIACYLTFGTQNIAFFGASALALCIGYVFHICDATGYSADDAISAILLGKNKTALQYLRGTMCCVVSLLITGIISTTLIAPVIFKETPVVEEFIEDTQMHKTTSEKESQFYEDIKDYFK